MIFALRGAVSRFFANDGFFLSAGLAFFVMVTFIPIVLLAVSTLGFVLTSEQAASEVVGHLARNFPVYTREIRSAMMRIVETRAVSGVVGTVILVAFSTPLFSASRLVLHRLLGLRLPQSFLRNFMVDSGLAILIGALLFAATIATWMFNWFEAFVLEPAGVSSRWLNITNLGFSVAVSAVTLYLAYRYMPRHRVRGSAALAGAVLGSLLWEVAKQLFSLYIRKVGIYDQIYGPLGVLIAFVMFVYYSAIVFVFGGAYVAAIETRRR
ncbi:MAG: YihY/virulence factor BrkB family protein [Candidatus Rokubacteria bacterium]|nr:YihY/virulence factor BrkB family protein [Candidatus Rokubacteria bacterium]